MSITITAQDIWTLHNAHFDDRGARGDTALVLADGALRVMPPSSADLDPDARIVLLGADLHEYCQGDLNDALAEQMAADLTRELQ